LRYAPNPGEFSRLTHVLKPQIGMLPGGVDLTQSVENEYLCLKLTAAFGLPSAHIAIEKFGGSRVLVVERSDRLWTRDKRLLRVPQEDCCQALLTPPTRKYESDGGPGVAAVLDLLKGSDDPEADQRFALKAQISSGFSERRTDMLKISVSCCALAVGFAHRRFMMSCRRSRPSTRESSGGTG
jgi:HipA-like C-terminal domain